MDISEIIKQAADFFRSDIGMVLSGTAALIAIVGVLIAVGKRTQKVLAKIKKDRNDIADARRELLSDVKDVSTNLGARTDIGFFLRERASFWRSKENSYLIVAVTLAVGSLVITTCSPSNKEGDAKAVEFGLLAVCIYFLWFYLAVRKIADEHSDLIDEIYKHHILKRKKA